MQLFKLSNSNMNVSVATSVSSQNKAGGVWESMEKEPSDVWSSVGERVRDLVWRNVLLLRGAQRLIETGCDNDWPEKVEKRRRIDASVASGALIVFKVFCGFLVLLFVEFLFFFSLANI